MEEAASGRQSYAVPVPNISSDDLCVVTGAADGIGRALAEAFARRGRHVVGIDVDSARAEVAEASLRTAALRATYLVADVANAGGRESILRSLCSLGRIRTLVHNAGVNRFGRFEEMDFVSLHRILDVNLAAPLQLNRLLLEGACWSDRAEFVFIASLSCFVGYPGASVYAATKDGLASYAGGLAASGRARGLRVLTVFPGPTRTEHARRNSPDNTREHRRMPPEELAQRIIHAVEAGSRNLVPGVGNRAAAFFGEWFPSTASRLLAKSLRVR